LLFFGISAGRFDRAEYVAARREDHFHGRSSATGYVLQESDHDLVIFNAKQNSIERVSRLQVDTRQFCAKRGFARHAMPLCP
jgi:hypothetical protein